MSINRQNPWFKPWEEKILVITFGGVYPEYKNRVKQWVQIKTSVT
ncbi:MAG: hypothetical protein ACFE95_02535 [Candidatus Hodarchaeota archaeon]